jgi:hypothetical protein
MKPAGLTDCCKTVRILIPPLLSSLYTHTITHPLSPSLADWTRLGFREGDKEGVYAGKIVT